MGATGSGKSTLLTNLVLGDIEAHRGVVVIDPKGDLVTDICARMPAGAEERVVLIDPEEGEAPPIMNVLAGPDPDLVVDNLVGIFRSIFAAYWGPRTDDVLRAACLTLLRTATDAEPVSLADVPRLLSDEEFRGPRVAAVTDDSVGLGGFWTWYEIDGRGHPGPGHRSGHEQAAGLLAPRLRAPGGRPAGAPASTWARVLDGGICLVRVPKGILGEETARLLGSFVVAKVWQTATHRARLGQAARVDAALYVDECQNFLNLPRSFDEMLAEARGYGLSMALAHQHLAQLPRDLREAVSANARTKVFFSMSPEDARVPGSPRRSRAHRARPGPPRGLPGRRSTGGVRRGDPGLHLAHHGLRRPGAASVWLPCGEPLGPRGEPCPTASGPSSPCGRYRVRWSRPPERPN